MCALTGNSFVDSYANVRSPLRNSLGRQRLPLAHYERHLVVNTFPPRLIEQSRLPLGKGRKTSFWFLRQKDSVTLFRLDSHTPGASSC